MSRILYTSDLHFNHPKVAQLRGYETAFEHDEELIERFNDFVRDEDQLWILGDLGTGKLDAVLFSCMRLRGQKHLVFGNHDPGHPMHKKAYTKQTRYFHAGFRSVQTAAMHRIDGRLVLLSHFPYIGGGDHSEIERHPQWRLLNEGAWLIHGHVHEAWAIEGKQMNVGVDQSPVPVEQTRIASMIANLEKVAP